MEKSKEVDPRRVCKYFQSGFCKHGKSCTFLHIKNYSSVCQFYIKGNCKKGKECKNIHPENQSNKEKNYDNVEDASKEKPLHNGVKNEINSDAKESKGKNKLAQAVQDEKKFEEQSQNKTIIPKRTSGRFYKRFIDFNKTDESKELLEKNNPLLWGEKGYLDFIKTLKTQREVDLAQFYRKYQSSLIFQNEERTVFNVKHVPSVKRELLNIDFEIDEGLCIFQVDYTDHNNPSISLINHSIPSKFKEHFGLYMTKKLIQAKNLYKVFREMDNKFDIVIEEVYDFIVQEDRGRERLRQEEERARAKAEEEMREKEETKHNEATKEQSLHHVWNQKEQNLLEQGMLKYRDIKDPKEKWGKIAEEVQTRTMQECLERFKEIRKRLQEEEEKKKAKQEEGSEDEKEDEGAEDDEEEDEDDEEGEEGEEDEEDEDEEEEEEEDDDEFGSDDEIMYIDAEPKNLEEKYGMELPILLNLNEINLRNIAYGKVSEIHLMLKCKKCKYTNDLTIRKSEDSENYLLNNIICVNCNTPSAILVKIEIFHKDRTLCARVGTINWEVMDTLQADFAITCESCSTENYCKKYVCGSFIGKNCMNCHEAIEFSFASYSYEREAIGVQKKVEGREKNVLDAINRQIEMLMKKKKVGNFKLGQPLPKNGACRHYKLSNRYFRFPCCGKAYPCDDCHNMVEKEHEQEMAKSMICGFCSYEQPIKEICGKCGGVVTKSSLKRGHWEGGKGCRDKKFMSSKDSHKFSGMSKTVSRKKINKTKK